MIDVVNENIKDEEIEELEYDFEYENFEFVINIR